MHFVTFFQDNSCLPLLLKKGSWKVMEKSLNFIRRFLYEPWYYPNQCWPEPQCHMMSLILNAFNTLRPRQNGRHFADDTFKHIFLNENVRVSIKIPLKLVPKGPIDNIPALVQIMAWRRPGDKPLSEPMMVRLPMHICVTRPQWVNCTGPHPGYFYRVGSYWSLLQFISPSGKFSIT